VNRTLVALLEQGRGIVTRRAALRSIPPHVWSYAVAIGDLITIFPGVAVRPELVGDPDTRRRAALAFAGPGAALSHTSALAVWGVPVPDDPEVHILTGPERRIRVAGIVAHRRVGFRPEPPTVVVRNGLPVTRLEQSLVDAWPYGSGPHQRAPLLYAVGQRWTTPARIAAALTGARNLPGVRELRVLLAKLAAGCRSELELWGHDHVFTGPGMPRFARQVPVRLGSRTVYLDVYHHPTRTNFELDGAAFHGSREQRERDLRRDAALATLGILVVRFSHTRLVYQPEQVREEVRAILAARSGAGRGCAP
jgi:very-short-patch-repair endonuclease